MRNKIKTARDMILSNGLTPILAVQVACGVVLPSKLMRQKIVNLDISDEAIRNFQIHEDCLTFSATFGGFIFNASIPLRSIITCFEAETGNGSDCVFAECGSNEIKLIFQRNEAKASNHASVRQCGNVFDRTIPRSLHETDLDLKLQSALTLIQRNGLTPYIEVQTALDVFLPNHLASRPIVVLNMESRVISDLQIDEKYLKFRTMFSGEEYSLVIPLQRILSCFEVETGICRMFGFRPEFERLFSSFLSTKASKNIEEFKLRFHKALEYVNNHSPTPLVEFESKMRLLINWEHHLVVNNAFAAAAEGCSAAWELISWFFEEVPELKNDFRLTEAKAHLDLWILCLQEMQYFNHASRIFEAQYLLLYAGKPNCESKAGVILNWVKNDFNLLGGSTSCGCTSQLILDDIVNESGLYCNEIAESRLLVEIGKLLTKLASANSSFDIKALNELGSLLEMATNANVHLNISDTLKIIRAVCKGDSEQAISLMRSEGDIRAMEAADDYSYSQSHSCTFNGRVCLLLKDHNEADRYFRLAWNNILKASKVNSDLARQLFTLSTAWIEVFPSLSKPFGWVRDVTAILSAHLINANHLYSFDFIELLHKNFSSFCGKAIHGFLLIDQPQYIIELLSRVSSWRMATALLDELETMVPAPEADDAARALLHYQRMRLEVRRLQQRLQEKENPAGRGGTDFSSSRDLGLMARERSPEAQARLNAELDALRTEYDHAYTQMQLARDDAAKVPGYEALSVDRHSLDSQKLLGQLKAGQAVLLVFDQQAPGETPDEARQLSGALLLKDGEVHWHSIDDLAQGSAFLHEFECLVGGKRGGEHGSVAVVTQSGKTPFYGDFRRGDVSASDEKSAHEPLVYQGETITHLNLWESLGQWVQNTLWKPLEQKGLLDGVQELVLVTQGQQAHAIPWQMGAPVPPTGIRRYPGLVFYAMDAGLMSRAACSDEPTLGIAHYEGVERPLPFARIEAEILGQIWTQSGRTAVQDFDYLKPQLTAGSVHIAGHGSHSPDPKEQTVISGLEVGQDTYWGLSQIMGSPSRPKEVYLSCCVAGRTTDLAGEQYGVTSALLQHGTREVVASSVSLNDLWGGTLSIATHSLMQQQGLPMREALHQAQLMVTRQRDWDEVAWAWVTQAWEMRLDAVLQERLTPLLAKLQEHSLAMSSDKLLTDRLTNEIQVNEVLIHLPHWGNLDVVGSQLSDWVAATAHVLRSHKGQADEAALRAMVQQLTPLLREALTWPTQAPPLIAGSLAFATAVFG